METSKINKYHNGKIYTIRSHQTEKYYIGSTCQPLHKRLYSHRNKYKHFCLGKGDKLSSFEIIKLDDNYIELLEEYKCENKDELTKREGELIRLNKNDIVNHNIAGRTCKEYYEEHKEYISQLQKDYYISNRDKILEKNKEYREDTKEKIQERNKVYYSQNKDAMNAQSRRWYQNNKDVYADKIKLQRLQNPEKFRRRNKERTICVCGIETTKTNIQRHMKTDKHRAFMNNKEAIVANPH
jgi:hypothetical protein